MHSFRTYGDPPYSVAVIHGGPGASGEMAPVARELSRVYGVLELLQTESTLAGQLDELKDVLKENGTLPVTLIGHSWGAMLGYIFTAQNPLFVKKLILVASGVFDENYATQITKTRLSRLTTEERTKLRALLKKLDDPAMTDKDSLFLQCGKLFDRADTFDPLPHTREFVQCQYEIFENVWSEVEKLRHGGNLTACGRHITCPVVAIHGDYDPHPADGIRIPLSHVVKDFRFVLLEKCGHYPWMERGARDRFYEILLHELR